VLTTGDIGGVLKKAMADTNLAVKMHALGIITKIATGMGQPFDKHTRILTSAVASVCADQKTTTRSAAIATLGAMADAAGGLDTMYAGLGTALESPNPALRASVLAWLAERLSAEATGDMSPLAGPVLSCLEDRNGDVRKGAGAVLPFVVASAGYEYVTSQTTKLKPASKATIVPLIQKAKETAAANAPAPAVAPAPAAAKPTAKPSRPASAAERSAPPSPAPAPAKAAAPGIPKPAARSAIPAPGRSLAMKSLGNAIPRPPSAMSDDKPTSTARPKVVGQARAPPAPASSDKVAPFTTSDSMPRTARVKRDAARWLLEPSPKSDLAEYLSAQMEPHTATDTFALLFSKDHRAEEDYMAALSSIAEFYDETDPTPYGLDSAEAVQAVQSANVDLAVKYAALKLLSNNTQLANRCLEVVGSVLSAMRRLNERFSDVEAKLFAPALVFKVSSR
jgi:cytoskeleton-associated protein 5